MSASYPKTSPDRRTYVAGVQNCSILVSNFWEDVALIEQETVHVPNMSQILLVSRRLTDSLPPFLDRLQNAMLNSRGAQRRPLGKPSDQLIQKLLGADLKVERVSAILDTDVEELY